MQKPAMKYWKKSTQTRIFIHSFLPGLLNSRKNFSISQPVHKGSNFSTTLLFKEIFNPESVPERLEEFLSLILNSNVKSLSAVLPNDSTRIADESSLLIMDIVVQLEHGPIVNLEIQKIGYKFPGERSACYSADLLLRQYKRVRSRRKKNFSYKDIKPVYTIVIFEHAPKEFHQFTDVYCHYAEQTFNTGLKLELLQKICLRCS